VIESDVEFAALASQWEELQKDATTGGIFECFDWQHLWWRTYGDGQRLKLLVATQDGVLTGILALYVNVLDMLAYPVRALRFVGTGGDTQPDDLGPVLAPGHEVETARALADEVMRLAEWDVLLLTDLVPTCPFTAAIDAAVRREGLACRTGRYERISYIDLPATWDAFLKTLHGDRRYRIRNIRKKLLAAHTARFFVWEDGKTLNEGIDRLIELHHKRWNSVGQAHGFSSDRYVKFHRAVMTSCFARNRLRLYCLELDGQIVAMYYFYKFRDRVYLMQSGFDPAYSPVKPGQVLLGYVIEHAIGEGHRILDFLKGEHRYKDEVASGQRETLYLTAFRMRLGGFVYRARRFVLPALKARVLATLRRLRPAVGGP
jgi:CelD/BcsL family acetyltransferase involved in cellulose biosynthesis